MRSLSLSLSLNRSLSLSFLDSVSVFEFLSLATEERKKKKQIVFLHNSNIYLSVTAIVFIAFVVVMLLFYAKITLSCDAAATALLASLFSIYTLPFSLYMYDGHGGSDDNNDANDKDGKFHFIYSPIHKYIKLPEWESKCYTYIYFLLGCLCLFAKE